MSKTRYSLFLIMWVYEFMKFSILYHLDSDWSIHFRVVQELVVKFWIVLRKKDFLLNIYTSEIHMYSMYVLE